MLEGEGDMLIEDVYDKSIDSQKLSDDIIIESIIPYGGKLLHEEEKFVEIQASIEEIRAEGLQS